MKYPNDSDTTRTEYTYDEMYRVASAAADVSSGSALTASYTYANDLLTSITTGSTTYNFTYGAYSQRSGISIGSRNLATYAYTADRNRYLNTLTYGNGDTVSYQYDDQGRVTKETFDDGTTVTYEYDNTGALATVTDSATGIKTTYYYDLIDRMVKYVESGSDFTHSVQYGYDTLNNLTLLKEIINGVTHTTSYTYDADNRVTQVTNGGLSQHYTYDGYGRTSQIVTKNGSNAALTSQMTFQTLADGRPTTQINSLRNTATGYDVTLTYGYDNNGNITSVSDGTNTSSYVYDSANQLLRENNHAAGKTWVWAYDDAGNILSRTEYAYTTGELGDPVDTVLYAYGDADWGDLLTSYDGNAITYDTIGNPLSDGVWSYTWQNGRELASMTGNGVTWSYTYDANGMRKTRSNGTDTYTYLYNGSLLVEMQKNNTDTLHFYYDANGVPVAVDHNGTMYYYTTSLQGDVIGILNTSGTVVVEYAYDAWGSLIETSGTMASTLGALNPLTYRAYIYDHETSLYYLQSRYYSPKIGRFLNTDAYTATGQGLLGNNMFAYCTNNPVNYVDKEGDIGILAAMAVGLVVGIASQFISGVIANAIEGKTGADLIKNTGTIGEYAASALTGTICAIPGAGAIVSVICDVAAPAVQQGIDCLFYEDYNWSWEQYTSDVVTNLVCDVAANTISVDVPKYIRDIKDEARSLGKKGTKALTAYLKKVQNQTFMINQGINVLTSAASELYTGAFTKIMSMI